MQLSTRNFPQYAHEYFGGDVQSYSFHRTGHMTYEIRQVPHWLSPRVVARCTAMDAREARNVFYDMAKDSDKRYA
jgi:hypothetical protein